MVCREFTDPPRLDVVEEPHPVPGPGEVLVEVDAAGVSFVDGLIAAGRYQVRPPLPFAPGSAVAGRVAAVGDGVTAPAPGVRVAGLLTGFGGFTSHVVLPAASAVEIPAGVDPDAAATALENYGTLVFAVTHRVTIARGEWVVVLGAGGGIGLAAVDVARSLGARVLAVASSEGKRAAARAAGAEATLGYDGLKDRIREVTGGGADVVLDPVGGPTAEAALRALGTGGRFCVVGFTSGEIPRLPANIVLLRNRTVVGVDWGDWARADSAAAVALAGDVLGRIGRGELHPPAPHGLPLGEAGEALRMLAAREVTGKLVLHP
ncbi:NADPH:quinone oxidoreductase family protein [Pseudonocardia sp. C8]|uniref:NADPH:quinone oxidoreductase family protein n=1 Tax=Pseudonocardia sp. C8 TaxID=2762759 RepID=UPI001642F4F1|nr:NADPH:quinone oxidoreductase family protein [Pseudonocardia sp. C8]MBC3192262.1 NADPH:quinone oxidoreductase family protein [Pseudonocardia sp. C8]